MLAREGEMTGRRDEEYDPDARYEDLVVERTSGGRPLMLDFPSKVWEESQRISDDLAFGQRLTRQVRTRSGGAGGLLGAHMTRSAHHAAGASAALYHLRRVRLDGPLQGAFGIRVIFEPVYFQLRFRVRVESMAWHQDRAMAYAEPAMVSAMELDLHTCRSLAIAGHAVEHALGQLVREAMRVALKVRYDAPAQRW